MLLGRSELTNQVKRAGRKCSLASIRIKAADTAPVLNQYVNDCLSRLHISNGLEQEIRTTIYDKAKGMFTWVRLLFNMLEDEKNIRSESKMRECLRKVPEGMESMLQDVLEALRHRLTPKRYEEMILITSWLSVSQNPLTIRQINAMISYLSCDNINVEDQLRGDYSTLLTVFRDDGMSTETLNECSSKHPRIPEATYVVFPHTSIREYFSKMVLNQSYNDHRHGIASKLPTHPDAALNIVLKSCIESMCVGGSKDYKSFKIELRCHAIEIWTHLLKQSLWTAHAYRAGQQVELIEILVCMLTEECNLREWCVATPSSFFDRDKCDIVSQWVVKWSEGNISKLNDSTRRIIDLWAKNPENIFRNAGQVLVQSASHTLTYSPLAAVDAVSQIRRFLPDLEEPDENEIWYTNHGNHMIQTDCLHEAQTSFEAALRVDRTYTHALSGLARVLQLLESDSEAIVLERKNLEHLQSYGETEDIRMQCCARSYETIATSYLNLADPDSALSSFEDAARTGYMSIEAALKFFRLLTQRSQTLYSSMIVQILRDWEKIVAAEYPNRLVEFLFRDPWPCRLPDNLFFIVAIAARNSEASEWLETECRKALDFAPSHLSALALQACVVFLYKRTEKGLRQVEEYIQIIMEACINDRNRRIGYLQTLTALVAQPYCLMHVRKAIEARSQDEIERCVWKIQALCSIGVEPLDIRAKIIKLERSCHYLAIIFLKSGRRTEALDVLQDLIKEATNLLQGTTHELYHYGLRSLTRIFLAVGEESNAMYIAKAVHSQELWLCSDCCQLCASNEQFNICRYCLECFCSSCLRKSQEDYSPGCCALHHSMWCVPASKRHPRNRVEWDGYRSPKKAIKSMIVEIMADSKS